MCQAAQDGYLELFVHENLHPKRVREQVERALRSGVVPTKLLYETPLQVRRWRELASSLSPAMRSDDGALAYGQIHTAAAGNADSDEVVILGLGCGDARKEIDLAKTLGGGRRLSFVPLDASLPLIQIASGNFAAETTHRELRPVLIDLEHPGDELSAPLESDWDGAVRILTLYGVLPWMNPLEALELCRSLMKPGDLLCVSANLLPVGEGGQGAVLAQYENEECRSWLELLLIQLEIADRAERLSIDVGYDELDHAALVISASLQTEADTIVRFEGRPVEIDRGQDLRVFRSARYSAAGLQTLLENCNFTVEEMAIAGSGQEAVALARL